MKSTQNTPQRFHLTTGCSLKRMPCILITTDHYVYSVYSIQYTVCYSSIRLWWPFLWTFGIWMHSCWPFTIYHIATNETGNWLLLWVKIRLLFFFVRTKIIASFQWKLMCVWPSKRLINCKVMFMFCVADECIFPI